MALSTTQQEVADCDKRWRVVVAGRRWGKTTLAIREICKVARFPEKEVYYISPSYRMSKTDLCNILLFPENVQLCRSRG